MRKNKTITLATLLMSAWPTVANFEVKARNEPIPIELSSSTIPSTSKSIDLEFIEFRNHRELHRLIDLNVEKRQELAEDLARYLSGHKIENADQAINYSLDFVSRSLDFRFDYFFGKKGSDYFKFPRGSKVTDCVDYAFLFDKTLKYVAKSTGLKDVKSQVIRSDGSIFGRRIDYHDWVKVTDTNSGRSRLICPTFYDYGINHNLEGKVK